MNDARTHKPKFESNPFFAPAVTKINVVTQSQKYFFNACMGSDDRKIQCMHSNQQHMKNKIPWTNSDTTIFSPIFVPLLDKSKFLQGIFPSIQDVSEAKKSYFFLLLTVQLHKFSRDCHILRALKNLHVDDAQPGMHSLCWRQIYGEKERESERKRERK